MDIKWHRWSTDVYFLNTFHDLNGFAKSDFTDRATPKESSPCRAQEVLRSCHLHHGSAISRALFLNTQSEEKKCCTKGNICPASKLIRLYFVYMQVIDIFKIHCFGAQRRALWEIFAWVVLKNSGQALNETWSTQPPTLLSSDNHCSCIWIYRAGHSWFNQFTNSQYTSKVDGLVISYHFPSYEK